DRAGAGRTRRAGHQGCPPPPHHGGRDTGPGWWRPGSGGPHRYADPTCWCPPGGSVPETAVTPPPPPPPAPATGAAARAHEATKIYGRGDTEVRALDGVTVEFATGEFTAIMGPSGSGKSTLMHCMAGLDSLTSGEVLVGDVPLTRLSERDLTRLRR